MLASLPFSSAACGLRCSSLNGVARTRVWKMPDLTSSSSASPRLLSPPRAFASSASSDDAGSSANKPWLLVGLGNPGKLYQRTRHNVGFEMLDAIAEAEGISFSSIHYKALFGKEMLLQPRFGNYLTTAHVHLDVRNSFQDTRPRWMVSMVRKLPNMGYICDTPVLLAKPQTFMNASGESVGLIASYYKIPLNQILLMYDDLDLPFAKLRLLPKGGHGGHNGMRSVISHLKGSNEFPRLKIGIGRPPGKMDPANFVLKPFNKKEREELEFCFQNGVEAVRILLLNGFDKSATFVNSIRVLNG